MDIRTLDMQQPLITNDGLPGAGRHQPGNWGQLVRARTGERRPARRNTAIASSSQMEICLAGRCLLLTISDRYIQYAAGWEAGSEQQAAAVAAV